LKNQSESAIANSTNSNSASAQASKQNKRLCHNYEWHSLILFDVNHLFTVGWNWAPDYGRSDDSKEMFEYLRAYSPLHNIKNDGTKYPAILVTTGDHDDRVVPAHSFKYAATLQAANTGDQPKLIRIDSKAGHGSGKPISKIIDEAADYYAFMMKNLGMKIK